MPLKKQSIIILGLLLLIVVVGIALAIEIFNLDLLSPVLTATKTFGGYAEPTYNTVECVRSGDKRSIPLANRRDVLCRGFCEIDFLASKDFLEREGKKSNCTHYGFLYTPAVAYEIITPDGKKLRGAVLYEGWIKRIYGHDLTGKHSLGFRENFKYWYFCVDKVPWAGEIDFYIDNRPAPGADKMAPPYRFMEEPLKLRKYTWKIAGGVFIPGTEGCIYTGDEFEKNKGNIFLTKVVDVLKGKLERAKGPTGEKRYENRKFTDEYRRCIRFGPFVHCFYYIPPGVTLLYFGEWRIMEEINTLNIRKYKGEDVYCDSINKKLYAFTRVETATKYYLVPTKIVRETGIQCCSDIDCVGINPNMRCDTETFSCVMKDVVGECISVLECPTTKVWDDRMKRWEVKEPVACRNRKCVYRTVYVECFEDRDCGAGGICRNNKCMYPVDVCNNNGICEPGRGETPRNCPRDCHCGNGICEPEKGEDFRTCDIDCEAPPDDDRRECREWHCDIKNWIFIFVVIIIVILISLTARRK